MSTFAGPPPMSSNPFVRIARDFRNERAARTRFPPGATSFSARRTQAFAQDPLPELLNAYERFGPVFTLRVFHANQIFALGPEANHHILVANAQNYWWRDGQYMGLIPLLGDGMLTIDGDFHRRSRKVMLPAFHHERIAAAHTTMQSETDAALTAFRPGETIDLYHWTRELALRIAMRALFGLDNETAPQAAIDFERALGFYSKAYHLQTLRGPGSPYNQMMRARKRLDRLIYAEIDRRRATGERGEDVLSLLLDARDETGAGLSRPHIRDEVMTLLFAGHDTTTSTVAFLFYELARNPELVDSDLDLLLDETLRMYPPAWIGPRSAVKDDVICGVPVPAGVPLNYCSWASHHLPDVWPDPERFDPQRFAPERRDTIPKGAYVPFGGGSRTCIGMRFGQAEIGVIAAAIRERFRLDLAPGYKLRIRQMPTIGPADGMPMVVRSA